MMNTKPNPNGKVKFKLSYDRENNFVLWYCSFRGLVLNAFVVYQLHLLAYTYMTFFKVTAS